MIAKLEFKLPEDEAEFRIACAASKYYSALWNFKQDLRSINKYEIDNFKTVDELLERVNQCWNTTTESIDWDEVP